jgi:hypothetical protein
LKEPIFSLYACRFFKTPSFLNSCAKLLNAFVVLKKILKELIMDKFASFAQCLEDPFLALKFRQDSQERQAILIEHGFDAQETQAICEGVSLNDERNVAELFGQGLTSYFMVVVVIDLMQSLEKSLLLAE